MELSLPKGCSPTPIFPTTPSKYVLPFTSTQPIDVPSSKPMIIDPNSPTIPCNTIHNQYSHQHCKNH